MIEKIGPTIYKGESIYNTGAGGSSGELPDDIILYTSLNQIGTVAPDEAINIEFGQDEDNENKQIIFVYSVNITSNSDQYLVEQDVSGLSTPLIYIYKTSSTSALYIWRNKHTDGSAAQTYDAGVSICSGAKNAIELYNGSLIDAFTGTTYQTKNSQYQKCKLGTWHIPRSTASQQNYNLKIYQIVIKDTDNIYHNFLPAKKSGIDGLFDKVTNNFYNGAAGKFICEGRIF